jgi:predicted ArsR family transcriptional regulator
MASPVRRRVLQFLVEAAHPVDAVAVAAELAMHVTTARFHLDQLEAAGLIQRAVERTAQRGRPRVLFTAAPAPSDDVQEQLNHALVSVISEDADGGRARAIRAGENWSAAFAGELVGPVDDAIAPIVRVLTTLEFEPEVDADGRAIALHACPFRDEARKNPGVVCSVHLGLLQGAARSLGRDEPDVGLRPFVAPELCMVDLSDDWRNPPASS